MGVKQGANTKNASMAMDDRTVRLNDLGVSMKVQNVQALAATDPNNFEDEKFLERYIRPEVEGPYVAGDHDIPVIDMQRLLDQNLSNEEARKLDIACEEWGFFQLVNHGICPELIEKMKVDTTEFFRLPLAVKEECAQEPGSLEGYGQSFVHSEDQKLDWADRLLLFLQPQSQRTMKFWPTKPSTFRETLDKYSTEVRRVALSLLGMMSKNLGLEQDKLVDLLKEAQSARINYYPPCPHAEKALGLSSHSDAVGMTMLLHVNDVQGLQIRKNGDWVSVKPIPGAFVVNIGDLIEIYTNGRYKSIEHRAMVHPEKERISIATFHIPKFGQILSPLPELVNGGKEKYRSISFEDFMKLTFSNKLDGKSKMERMKLNT